MVGGKVMDKKQIKQALQQIAAEQIPTQTDLWPDIEKQLAHRTTASRFVWLPKLGTALVAVLLLGFFFVWLNSLSQLQSADRHTAVSSILMSEPPSASLGFTFPAAPATLPRYQVNPIMPPDSREAALAWAENFGFANPQPFYDPQENLYRYFLNEDGSRLEIPRMNIGIRQINYERSDFFDLPLGAPVSVDIASAAAISFLEEHHQLPEKYHVRNILVPFFNSDGYPLRTIRISPDLAGYPLQGASGAGPGAVMNVDTTGEVFWATFTQADFVGLDEVAIRPAEAVVADFVNGRLAPLHIDEMLPADERISVKQYRPPLPEYQIGQSVTILETDNTHFMFSENSIDYQAVLHTTAGVKYELITPDITQIAEATVLDVLQVSGTIIGRIAPDSWQLSVTAWETFSQPALLSGCASGTLTIEENSVAWLTADSVIGQLRENGRYHIPNLPADIQNGDHIEVCAEGTLTLMETLSWSTIYAPPRSWHYEDQAAMVNVSVQSDSPYQLGDAVTLKGLVDATIYEEENSETTQITLSADLGNADSSHLFSLVGDETLLAELVSTQLNHYVQITGTIVQAESTIWGEQAIAVEAFAQPWPQQQVKAYVGRFSQERDGEDSFTLFTDEADGQSYALPENGPRFEGLLDVGKVWIAGVIHPTEQINGRPVLRIVQWFTSQGDEVLTPGSYPLPTTPQRIQNPPLPKSLERENLVLDHIELIYFFSPPDKPDIAEPAWAISGHRRDTPEMFVIYLDAMDH
jgi:hypothetical protein